MWCRALALSAVLACAAPAAVADAPAAPAREGLQAVVREVSRAVERIRGLRFKTPVSMELISGAAAREGFRARIEARSVELARHAQSAYAQLGLVPEGTDLLKSYLDMAEKDVLGYYDSEAKRLYLLDHVQPPAVRGVVAHELTHALEDQHFDFGALRQGAAGDDDRATALSAVIEGSAMLVMLAFVRDDTRSVKQVQAVEEGELRRARRLRGAPTFAQQSAMLPYLLGFTFLLKGKPWTFLDGVPVAHLDAAYASPPRSTRQILHPEQYWWGAGRRPFRPVSGPDVGAALGPGWTRAVEGSIGELGLAVLTGSRLDVGSSEAYLPSRWTNEAAAGTAGDVFQHYVNGDRRATLLLTRWETERDADQFDAALQSRGRYFVRYGVNLLVVAGDVDYARAADLGRAAMQRLDYFAAE